MFAQHFHDAPIRRDMIVGRENCFYRTTILYFKDVSEAIGIGLIGAEEAEILLHCISGKDVAQHLTKLTRRFVALRCRLLDINSVLCKVGEIEIDQELSTICMWIGTHTAISPRSQRGKLRNKMTLFVKHIFWMIAVHPFLKHLQMCRVRLYIRYRHLVGTECSLNGHTIDYLWPGPAFRSTQDDSRPAWSFREAILASLFLIRAYLRVAAF